MTLNKSNNQIKMIRTKSNMNHLLYEGQEVNLFTAIDIKSSLISNSWIIRRKLLLESMFLLSIFSSIMIIMMMVIFVPTETKAMVSSGSEPTVIAVKEGADLDLSCPIVVQNEDMIISWTCDNEPANIRSSRIHVTDSGKLRIKSAKVGDACNYRCEAADGYGTLSMIVKVIIVDKRMRDKLTRMQNHNLSNNHHHDQPSMTDSTDGSRKSDNLRRVTVSNSTKANNINMNGQLIQQQQQQQQAQQADLEVQVEPSNLIIETNRTFSLECKVKHAPNVLVPQIIWLKEFIGPEPNSMNEAHEQNLVIIDDVYYHGLNWPRSVSYSEQSACLNSALIVRQSSFVHSGRYICFAGYPPSIMNSYNMSLMPPTPQTQQGATITTSISNDNSDPSSKSAATVTTTMKQPLKYKMALAWVKVGNLNAETEKQKQLQRSDLISALTSSGPLPIAANKQPKNLLISIFSTDSWMRNLTACLTLLCGIIIGVKLIYIRYKSNNSSTTANNNGNNSSGNSSNNNKTKQAPDELACHSSISALNSIDTPINQQFHSHHQPHHYQQTINFSTTIQTSTSGINSTNCSQQILLSGASRKLEESLMCVTQLSDESSDSDSHLYSEIGGESDKIISTPHEYRISLTSKIEK